MRKCHVGKSDSITKAFWLGHAGKQLAVSLCDRTVRLTFIQDAVWCSA